MARLNPAQKQAVNTLSGPLLVLAGAGSGKTRVIAHRIAELIKRGIDPERILAVTFTNKAAREMKERVSVLLKKKRLKSRGTPEVSTFHSLCVRILRRQIHRLGYPKSFAIYDRNEQETIARGALRDVHVGPDKLRPGDLLAMIGSWKSRSVRPEQALETAESDRAQLAAMAYARYQEALRGAGAVDFDDLLLCTEEVFDRFPRARRDEAARYDHLLIDEYQDTNHLQYRIVRALAKRHKNLCVVGDDDQSIYGWRGAEVTHILGFQKDWPGATVVRLEENYRSRAAILEAANRLIAFNRTRHDKVLRPIREGGDPPRMLRFEDEVEEATVVVREIRRRGDAPEHERVPPGSFAILFRTNEQPRAFEMELRRARVPYVLVGGQSFYDRREIRDVLAYLKVLARPEDEVSLLRVINTPSRGIGASTVQQLVANAVEAGCPVWNVLGAAHTDARIPDVAGQRVERFRALVEKHRQQVGKVPLPTLAERLLGEIGYKDELERLYKNPADVESRWSSIEELVNSMALFEQRTKGATLERFLEDAVLSSRDDLQEEADKRAPHAVKLMTLHSAKGLEFGHVFMVGMEEDLLPHHRSVADGGAAAIDEERRLAYVGVTRAMDTLTLTLTKTRMKWGKPRPSIPSRFLMELKGDAERAKMASEAAAARHRKTAPGQSRAETPKPSKPPSEPAARVSVPKARRARRQRQRGAS